MAHIIQLASRVKASHPLPPGTTVTVASSHVPLMSHGFNFPVTISTASSVKNANPDSPTRAVTVMAHFDTGAGNTSIDTSLAQHIGLVPVGMSTFNTAAGPSRMPNYAVDISFPTSQLKPFINLPIGSCKLPFQIDTSGSIALTPQNFGLLIGRDIMSRWNIVWNGPTSTVFVSD